MRYHQLQMFNVKTMTADSSLTVPKGTPTCSLVRKEGRSRGHGVLSVDCTGEDELIDLACFLVARNQIVKALTAAVHNIDTTLETYPLIKAEIEAAFFMATGFYAPGAGQAQPIGIDTWRRRNGLPPRYGHLTEAEVREHVKAMDEHQKRAYNPQEPFELQLSRYVAQLRTDSSQWSPDEAKVMGRLLRELEAGYVLDRGETAHMGGLQSQMKALKGA